MQSQKVSQHETISDVMAFGNDAIEYLAIANVFGEIVEIESRNPVLSPSKQDLSENLRKVTLATNVLTFENIKVMILNIGGSNAVIINLPNDTIIVGMKQSAVLSDFAEVLSLVSRSDLLG